MSYSIQDKIKYYSKRSNDSTLTEGQRKFAKSKLNELKPGVKNTPGYSTKYNDNQVKDYYDTKHKQTLLSNLSIFNKLWKGNNLTSKDLGADEYYVEVYNDKAYWIMKPLMDNDDYKKSVFSEKYYEKRASGSSHKDAEAFAKNYIQNNYKFIKKG